MTRVPTQPKEQSQKIALMVIGLIVILIIVILFFSRFLNLFTKDTVSMDDSDLQLQRVSVPDKDNAYLDLVKLDNVIYEPKDKSQVILDMVAGKTWDNKVAEEIVSKNTQAFEYFAEAASKPKFQDPALVDPANITQNTVLPDMNSWRRTTRLSAIKALYLSKRGKDREALDEALSSVNIGQKMQESQALVVGYLVATAMKGVGLETVQKIIPSVKLSSGELNQYAQNLNQFYKNEDGFTNSLKGEYKMQSWAINSIVSGDADLLKSVVSVVGGAVGAEKSQNSEIAKKIKDNYYFQPNKTKLLFAEYLRVNIKNANESCGGIKAIEVKPLTSTDLAKLYTEENAIGKILYNVVVHGLTRIRTKKCQEDLLVGATQAMIAIKAFKNDTKNYPASLNELVPDYLSSVPRDPFDGKLLKYSAVKKILYSVGEDLQDSGGSNGDNWRDMADPTFILNF